MTAAVCKNDGGGNEDGKSNAAIESGSVFRGQGDGQGNNSARNCSETSALQPNAYPRPLEDSPEQVSDRAVGTVVFKAKRAAASLWMILHAQACRLGGSGCPHRGCSGTKKLLLHVKTCAAGSDFECPQGYQECQQARKLLLHYRRCREARARQVGQLSGGRSLRQQQHACLVCSLVARHARTVLQGGKAPDAPMVVRKKSTPGMSSSGISMKPKRASEHVVKIPLMVRSTSMQMMPPPPPRPPFVHGAVEPSNALVSTRSMSASSTQALHLPNDSRLATAPTRCEALYGRPSTTWQLMQRGAESVAADTGPPPLAGGKANTILPGKSPDSSRSFFLSSSPVYTKRTVNVKTSQPDTLPGDCNMRRPRAMSYDERKISPTLQNGIVQSRSNSCFPSHDPTLEVALREEQSTVSRDCQAGDDHPSSCVSVRRSSSCGVLSALSRPGGCGTIAEDGWWKEGRLDGAGE